MPDIKQERWRELCEMAIVESDPQRVTELFRQIDQLLSEPEELVSETQSPAPVQAEATLSEPEAPGGGADPDALQTDAA